MKSKKYSMPVHMTVIKKKTRFGDVPAVVMTSKIEDGAIKIDFKDLLNKKRI